MDERTRIVVDRYNRAKRRTPRALLLEAVAATAQGAGGAGSGLQLAFVGTTIERDGDRWVPYSDRPVTLIGALLIVHRVRVASDAEMPSESAARLLSVSPHWICGLDEGWKMDLNLVGVRAANATAIAAGSSYAVGFELGAEMRFLVTRVCRACGLRNMRNHACPCGVKS